MLLVLALLGATYVDDPLTASSFTTRTGSRGGTFSATGWTVTDEPDTIWYRIDDALTEARIEYTVTGMEVGAAPASLRGADHDILVVYNALASPAEPVPYAPGFRNNDFKFFTRIFGVLETGRPGAMKLELASCPQGDPWFHDSCPANCGQDLIAYANGNQQSPGWNAATSYRMALWWNNGTAGFDRDGVTLGTVSYTGSYAPQPLMIRFGSPRHDGVYPGAAMMPIGITIKDVKITGTAGTRTLACGAPPPPPPPPPPADAGMVMPGANTVAVLQDVTVANWETAVFPDVNDLNVEGSGSAPTGIAYLRFPQFSGVVNKAILKLHSQAISSASGGSGEVCTVSDSTWQETTLTWAARPALGSCAGSARSVTPDVELEWDVTALYAAGAPAGLAVVSRDPDGTHLLSKESGGAARGPRLYLELSAAPADAGVTTDAGTPDAGSTSPDAGSTPGDGGSTVPDGGSGGNMMASSGCGCGAGGTGGSVLVLLAALLLLRRHHR